MNKKITFLISLCLILTMIIGVSLTPASSYESTVKPSSKAILLINLDTDTVVYNRNEDVVWYTGALGEIMTFIVAAQNIPDLDATKVEITQEYIDSLSDSDGCLDRFIGQTLSARDLMAIMMLTSGNDAAHLLANVASENDPETFIKLMNRKASELGCTVTTFQSPGYYVDNGQLTTCTEMAKIYRYAMKIDAFNDIVGSPTHLPEGLDKQFAIVTDNSMMVDSSPYYFRYATGGKYSLDGVSKSNYVATTTYSKQTYLFVALKGTNEAEKNVFVDAKRLTTWAYLNLSDRRVIPADTVLGTTKCVYPWGEEEIELSAQNTALRTLPNEYDDSKITVKQSVPDSVSLPVFEGQNIGTAKVYYKKKQIDRVDLVSTSSKGVSMLSDLTGFFESASRSLMPAEPETEPATEETAEATEKATEKSTKAAEKAEKATSNKEKAETETKAENATETRRITAE